MNMKMKMMTTAVTIHLILVILLVIMMIKVIKNATTIVWGKEYVARFERDPNTTKQQLEAFEAFTLWTRTQKKKHAFGFWASMPKKRGQGDDSFQSP
jgi:hypothetical protein